MWHLHCDLEFFLWIGSVLCFVWTGAVRGPCFNNCAAKTTLHALRWAQPYGTTLVTHVICPKYISQNCVWFRNYEKISSHGQMSLKHCAYVFRCDYFRDCMIYVNFSHDLLSKMPPEKMFLYYCGESQETTLKGLISNRQEGSSQHIKYILVLVNGKFVVFKYKLTQKNINYVHLR